MSIRSRTALFGAGACVALLAVDWVCAFHVAFFARADQSIYLQFGGLEYHGRIVNFAGRLVSFFDPNPYVYLALIPIAVALVRGRPRSAVAAGAIVLGANVTTELVKHLVASPRPGWLFPHGISPLPPASWPSGHSTAVMSFVLACVLAAPARRRPLVGALGGCLAVGVGYSVLATGMHYPSDVLGGFLVATTWALLTVAALRATDRPRSLALRPDWISLRAALGPTGAVVLGALLLSAIVIVTYPHDVVGYARSHEAFVVGAAAIGVLGLALSTGVALTARR
jgi:membrane-associated phospholipid phosphatase